MAKINEEELKESLEKLGYKVDQVKLKAGGDWAEIIVTTPDGKTKAYQVIKSGNTYRLESFTGHEYVEVKTKEKKPTEVSYTKVNVSGGGVTKQPVQQTRIDVKYKIEKREVPLTKTELKQALEANGYKIKSITENKTSWVVTLADGRIAEIPKSEAKKVVLQPKKTLEKYTYFIPQEAREFAEKTKTWKNLEITAKSPEELQKKVDLFRRKYEHWLVINTLKSIKKEDPALATDITKHMLASGKKEFSIEDFNKAFKNVMLAREGLVLKPRTPADYIPKEMIYERAITNLLVKAGKKINQVFKHDPMAAYVTYRFLRGATYAAAAIPILGERIALSIITRNPRYLIDLGRGIITYYKDLIERGLHRKLDIGDLAELTGAYATGYLISKGITKVSSETAPYLSKAISRVRRIIAKHSVRALKAEIRAMLERAGKIPTKKGVVGGGIRIDKKTMEYLKQVLEKMEKKGKIKSLEEIEVAAELERLFGKTKLSKKAIQVLKSKDAAKLIKARELLNELKSLQADLKVLKDNQQAYIRTLTKMKQLATQYNQIVAELYKKYGTVPELPVYVMPVDIASLVTLVKVVPAKTTLITKATTQLAKTATINPTPTILMSLGLSKNSAIKVAKELAKLPQKAREATFKALLLSIVLSKARKHLSPEHLERIKKTVLKNLLEAYSVPLVLSALKTLTNAGLLNQQESKQVREIIGKTLVNQLKVAVPNAKTAYIIGTKQGKIFVLSAEKAVEGIKQGIKPKILLVTSQRLDTQTLQKITQALKQMLGVTSLVRVLALTKQGTKQVLTQVTTLPIQTFVTSATQIFRGFGTIHKEKTKRKITRRKKRGRKSLLKTKFMEKK